MSYDLSVVAAEVQNALASRGRGAQTQLAHHLGVAVQTVNKWAKGQTTPDQERWPEIEAFFGWESGYLIRLALGQPIPMKLSASGIDLTELERLDPEGYQSVLSQADLLLRRARERRRRRAR